MKIRTNVYIDCHVALDVTITPEPTDTDIERIDDDLEEEMLESIYAARQATTLVKRVVKIEAFEVTIHADFIYDEGWDGALRWEDADE